MSNANWGARARGSKDFKEAKVVSLCAQSDHREKKEGALDELLTVTSMWEIFPRAANFMVVRRHVGQMDTYVKAYVKVRSIVSTSLMSVGDSEASTAARSGYIAARQSSAARREAGSGKRAHHNVGARVLC